MKINPHRRNRAGRRPLKARAKRIRKSRPQVTFITRPVPPELSCDVGDDEALAVEESLDERERRG